MAVLPVVKLGLTVHKNVEREVLGAIQSFGLCEIISSKEERAEDRDGGSPKELCYDFDAEALLGDARYALRVLESSYEDSGDPLARILERPEKTSLARLQEVFKSFPLSQVADDLRAKERALAKVYSERSKIESLGPLLEALEPFPYELSLFTKGTEFTEGLLGALPEEHALSVKAELEKLSPYGEVFVYPWGDSKSEQLLGVVLPREMSEKAGEILLKTGFTKIDIPEDLSSFAAPERVRLQERLTALRSREEILNGDITSMAAKNVPFLRKIVDYLSVLKSREEVSSGASATNRTKHFALWCPEAALEDLKKILSPFAEQLHMETLPLQDEDLPPTFMRNPRWVLPYEPLTKLYGAPAYGGIDPTVFFAPFFVLFYGMCLSDAGYGIFLGAVLFWVLKKYNVEGETRKFLSMLFWASVSTVIIGALTGAWFGNMFGQFPFLNFMVPVAEKLTLLNPMNDPITFLVISLALGVVQVLFGLSIAMARNFMAGDYVAGIGDQGGWIALIIGLILVGLGSGGFVGAALLTVGKIVAALGALTLVLTQGRDKPGLFRKALSGVMSLYDITAYLGDVLSYSRLLALGLATAAVAMIIDTLTVLVSGIPYVGWLFGILLFLGGHLFSIAVNALGAFVHSLRLQYVEFFSKFFTASGRFFKPYRFDTKYTTVTGERD